MKIVLESTDKVMDVHAGRAGNPVKARVWEGHTDSGITVIAMITRVAIPASELTPEREAMFQRELRECKQPSAEVRSWPLRFFLD